MLRLALVLPCYNEEEVLPSSFARITDLLARLIHEGQIAPNSFALFVNDGSADTTWQLIAEAHQSSPYICGLNLSGNVGHQRAIMAGMMQAYPLVDAVITIDADLQDDLGAIPEMLQRYEEGYDIVYGVKTTRAADPKLKRMLALGFYRVQAAMGIKAIYNHADFRLMSKRALVALASYPERNLYLRGIIPMLGFKSTYVIDEIREREAGESKYKLSKMLMLAVDGITSFSTRPITWITSIGFFSLLVSLLMAIYVLTSYLRHDVVHGWASIMMSLWFIGSMILLSIGIVGQYIGKIYIEVKGRPLYHVEQFLYRESSTSSTPGNRVTQSNHSEPQQPTIYEP